MDQKRLKHLGQKPLKHLDQKRLQHLGQKRLKHWAKKLSNIWTKNVSYIWPENIYVGREPREYLDVNVAKIQTKTSNIWTERRRFCREHSGRKRREHSG